jgi:WD40 repeat protein
MYGELVDLEQEERALAAPNTNSVELDDHGRYAAFLSEDGRVEVRALPSEDVVAELAHDALGAAFSPDGAHIATAGRDGALRVWELAAGAEVARMDHPDKLFSPTFSADGRYLAAESADGWVWLWTWRPEDVAAEARARAGRELSADERARYLPEV